MWPVAMSRIAVGFLFFIINFMNRKFLLPKKKKKNPNGENTATIKEII